MKEVKNRYTSNNNLGEFPGDAKKYLLTYVSDSHMICNMRSVDNGFKAYVNNSIQVNKFLAIGRKNNAS